MLLDQDFGADSRNPWGDFTMSDYEAACESCEICVLVDSVKLLRQIRGGLFYDRRQQGSHGRAMRWPIANTNLEKGDRLEPTLSVPDTSLIDDWGEDDLPKELLFWRETQKRVKHRNPLFNRAIDVTPMRLIIDTLHVLNLGVLLRFAQ